ARARRRGGAAGVPAAASPARGRRAVGRLHGPRLGRVPALRVLPPARRLPERRGVPPLPHLPGRRAQGAQEGYPDKLASLRGREAPPGGGAAPPAPLPTLLLSPLRPAPPSAGAASLAPVLNAGSVLHGFGCCKPCAFLWKPSGCGKGQACQHCHLCPAGELQARRRPGPELTSAPLPEKLPPPAFLAPPAA
ncbi:unnamed protein product, partial [Prorocentrum cordatum]